MSAADGQPPRPDGRRPFFSKRMFLTIFGSGIVGGVALFGTVPYRRDLMADARSLLGLPSGNAPEPPPVPLPPRRRSGGDGSPLFEQEWMVWRGRYLGDDGRVIDTGNGDVSHSEGQSYGLLFAEAANDKTTFDLILSWTVMNLTRPSDALMAWRWDPRSLPHVTDQNNASDGDVIAAWACSRAAARWGDPKHLKEAQARASAILAMLVDTTPDGPLLRPGVDGFEIIRGHIINPSYYSFLAFSDLQLIAPDPVWSEVSNYGVSILRRARFGHWNLPPDWLWVPTEGGDLSWSPDNPPRFSYDAMRIPLHMVWAGLSSEPVVAAAAVFWQQGNGAAWTDLQTNALSIDFMSPGHRAIAALAQYGRSAPNMPSVAEAQDYYAGSLVLLARLASIDFPLG
jgi:hypothetical protein